MSRSHHSRPQRPGRDDARSRVTQAAISVADTFTRFDHDVTRLQRAGANALAAGLSPAEVSAAIQAASRGRDDRRRALDAVTARLDIHPTPDPTR